MRLFIVSILIFLASLPGQAADLVLFAHDAEVWHPRQALLGQLEGFRAQQVTVHHNQRTFFAEVPNGQTFTFDLVLSERENLIWAEARTPDGQRIVSDTLRYTLAYKPVPIVKPYARVQSNHVSLHARLLENPLGLPLSYAWQADPANPARATIEHAQDSVASVAIPSQAGDYYFNLLVVAGRDSVRYQTLVRQNGGVPTAYDIDTAYPSWMHDAVVYQITPRAFTREGTFAHITQKLPELKQLGINTIWLQPITKSSYKGQGYDVVDYLGLNPDFGSEQQLRELIAQAKQLQMRVLFDLVLNHSSIQHPYAQDLIKHGERSHYYAFYQHTNDKVPYSSFYNKDEHGFITYFWKDLVNFNYANEEVQRWILEVCKYWVREFDIDGYRFDAIWGVRSREPAFSRRLRTELKSIKPELLMLAEDKGSVPEVYKLGFDAAYDWTADTNWVSQWSWEYEYSESESKTLFSHPDESQRGTLLSQALFQNSAPHRLLRFMENNDLPRFMATYDLPRTQLASALLFSLPGIPMLYNGQEVGFRGHPYRTHAVFSPDSTIRSQDQDGLFDYYQKLIRLRQQHAVLRDTTLEQLPLNSTGSPLVAFRRWSGKEQLVALINLGSTPATASVAIREALPAPLRRKKLRFKEALHEGTYTVKKRQTQLEVPLEAYTMKWLLLEEK
ncbi:hypothetical protein GCM10027275_53880 [Rhabdobacter roseus]|uniref:Glycosidase n=1 Tax=Rhabdobacter roseus TaxID=1655419 RepID=A0A840U0F7_9BACT|nr:alpha-amylase family glycosyl hydrolase [Rhabdobacter roseus]MBB5287382.1 glycosidase [Rhabdobacter roseus]